MLIPCLKLNYYKYVVYTDELILSDYNILGRVSGKYTHVSEAHNTTSWLDQMICSHDMNALLQDIDSGENTLF